MQGQTWYRATCFGRAIGPWRSSRERARDDLIAEDLGDYDEWGNFFITVPGDIECRYERAQSKAA